jgi:flavin reductase (DIM6/NTAB) family NADH-FMN oxidoreductase RutF
MSWREVVDKAELKSIRDRLNTTGCVVTSIWDSRPAGCFAGYLTNCSMEPRRLLVCTSHENLTHEIVERSGVLAVHLVAHGQEEWVRHWGWQSGRDVDKFAGIAWHAGVTGAPILDDAIGYLEGRVLESLNCGDHTARLVEPLAAELRDADVEPLTLFDVFTAALSEPGADKPDRWFR